MSLEINGTYILAPASLEMAKEISDEVNQAYGAHFNKYIEDAPGHPIERTDENKIREMILDPSMSLYVLIEKTSRVVAGTICYVPTKKRDQGYFGLFSLAEEAKGKHIGSQMVSLVESKAKADGKKRMKIDVSGFAEKLHGHYEQLGYQRTGKTVKFEDGIHWKLKPKYAASENADFVIFKKNLIS